MNDQKPVMPPVSTLVVGGVADGLLVMLPMDAQIIELGRPTHMRPLETPSQGQPDIATETDEYEIHPIALTNTQTGPTALSEPPMVFSLAVVKGDKLTDAFSELLTAYVKLRTDEATAETFHKPY